jgi:general secretion pathway protein D
MIGLTLSAQTPEMEPQVNFNFEQVEIGNLVNLVGEQTGKRFVLDAAVTGRVSVITREKIPQSEVFPLFVAVLEGVGYTVVNLDGVYHIRRLVGDDPLQAPVVGAESPLEGVGLITRVIKLEHVRAADVRPLLEPMVRRAENGSLSAFAPTNHLVITDTASNIKRIEELLSEIDRQGQSTQLSVIPLEYASARDLADQISAALRGAESSNAQLSRRVREVVAGNGSVTPEFTLIAADQANSLIVSAGPLQLKQIQDMVKQLDVPPDTIASGRLRAVFLNYLKAEEAAAQLTTLLDKRTDVDARDRIAVEADVANNAILVDASPLAFSSVKELLETIDRPQQQVLVEVMIVEVTDTNSLELGVEWATIDQPDNGTTTVVGRSRPGEANLIQSLVQEQAFPQGFTFGLARGTLTLPDGTEVARLPFLLRALEGRRDVNILSNVPLRTQNNAEASVRVVNNIPILTSVIEGGTGDDRDVIQNIERLDVGIQLTVKPQVNPNKEITLELNPIIEAIVRESSGGVELTPTIARREVKSTLTLPDRATVVISGLIREDVVEEVNQVPVLGSLPFVGAFFRSTNDRKEKTNLLIFVTPYLVTGEEENDATTDRWQKRTGLDDPSQDPRQQP